MNKFASQGSHNNIVNNTLIALAVTLLVIMLDIVFCVISPRSFFYIGRHALDEKLVIICIDALVSFGILSVFLFFRNLLRTIIFVPLMIVCSAIYLVSWATFLIVGDFLGLDSIKFVYENFQQLLWIISQISKLYCVILFCLLLAPLVIYALSRPISRYFSFRATYYLNIRAILFQFAIMVLVAMMLLIFSHGENIISEVENALRYRSSPQLTLLFDQKLPERSAPYGSDMKKLNVLYQEQRRSEQPQLDLAPTPVIMIVIESLRSDILDTLDVMPHLYELQKDFIPLKAFAPSNVTNYSWPAIFTSQYPIRSQHQYFYPATSDSPRVTVYDVLKQVGYRTAIFSAQNEHWGGMNNALNTKSLDVFFSSEYSEDENYVQDSDVGFAAFSKNFKTAGKLDDALVVDKALQWLSTQQDHGFFIAMNFQRSHFPYTWPESFSPPFPFAEPSRWYYPELDVEMMRYRYWNSLRYVDEQVGRVIKALKERGLYEKSLIFIMGDHGEAFYEHGQTCHGNDLFNETAATLLFYKNSKELAPLAINKIPELIDIAPTILKLLKLSPHPSFQGQSLDDAYPSRPVFITVNSPVSEQDAIVDNGWKMIADKRNDRLFLFDLAHDPQESQNLIDVEPKKAQELLYQLMVWRNAQLKYYSDTSLQKKFYPPRFSFE
ncbi:MAG: sulfatase-like hydrolase/transferase [Candidatus Omnitrophica bacterium]|nr:sulfatase-like hydrolase/transferase [Candidatus Omnitrophota bacterium]